MPGSTDATPRRKRTSQPSGASARRKAPKAGKPAARRSPARRRWWPLGIAATVIFLLAYVLDPDAVGRLLWAGMGGQLGQGARVATCAALILVGTALAWAWTRPATEPAGQTPAKVRRPAAANPEKKRRRTARSATPPPDGERPAEAAEETTPEKKRRRAARPATPAPAGERAVETVDEKG